MEYSILVNEVLNKGIVFKEIPLSHNKEWGLCKGNVIAVNKNLNNVQKKCVLAEELGHFYTTVGDITDLSDICNAKQEELARRYGYKKLIPIQDLIKTFKMGLRFDYEIAEELGVTINFLHACVNYYKCRYETNKYLKEG
ncbi:ImmA/IrrE family metallo-endopeptidase [Hathewaya proteolytica]|uniref:ImmA/IrrE family metallo-endopeptidase n=1 Tax=Hathewaya proteolytica TaxID=29365 RepID=UPI000933DED6|nr:ImmA/IrrE family metallo-endopeptidase [Hathewaya proteolytica]